MKRFLSLAAIGVCLSIVSAQATTSPFAHVETGPLNQSANDDLNGKLAVSTSAVDLSVLTDATSSTSPTGSILLAPGSESVDVTWDLGAETDPASRQLNSVSLWFDNDPTRNGMNGSLSTSLDGSTFNLIFNSSENQNWADAPGSFHNVIYDFSGTNVSNFRYIRLSLGGYFDPGSPSGSPPLVEVDVFTAVPEPSTIALFAAGAAIAGVSIYRKKRQTA